MNRPLASLFLLVSLLSSITVAQTGTKKQRAERPASRGDLKICQGVSLPDGYIIVGYVTSPACPHGAYLLKKQAPPQVAAAVANNVRQAAPPQTKCHGRAGFSLLLNSPPLLHFPTPEHRAAVRTGFDSRGCSRAKRRRSIGRRRGPY